MNLITHALKFASLDVAKAAAEQFFINGVPRADFVDAAIPSSDGSYLMNVALPVLNSALRGLLGAWDTVDPVTGEAHLVYGVMPETPTRVFA